MREYTKGERLLLEAVAQSDGAAPDVALVGGTRVTLPWQGTDNIHPHPGVPPADLIRERKLLTKMLDEVNPVPPLSVDEWNEYRALREAFEATVKPQYVKGQRVEYRTTVDGMAPSDAVVAWIPAVVTVAPDSFEGASILLAVGDCSPGLWNVEASPENVREIAPGKYTLHQAVEYRVGSAELGVVARKDASWVPATIAVPPDLAGAGTLYLAVGDTGSKIWNVKADAADVRPVED